MLVGRQFSSLCFSPFYLLHSRFLPSLYLLIGKVRLELSPNRRRTSHFASLPPVELTDIILSLLPQSDLLSVCSTSFGLLQQAAPIIYTHQLDLSEESPEVIDLFISARVCFKVNVLLPPDSNI